MSCEFGDVDQDRRGEDVIGSDVIRGHLCREDMKDILRTTGRKMLQHGVSIVRVGARFATCQGDAGFGSRAR